PKGVLLFGPPGCGKTMIAKAVANSIARRAAERGDQSDARSYFINIKGPELLNKYVGETERHIRRIFQRARQKASEGFPVVIFFDEMEAMFRVRGSGISSDVNSTIVPQLLAEIDGVEQLNNVIVIGASNREDLIDPAILRPGRLDVKIRINRPGAAEAESIFGRYLNTDVPLDPGEVDLLGGGDANKAVLAMIEQTVEEMYAENDRNAFLEIQYERGDRQILYFRDFASGAMIEHIVRRAKKNAVKRSLAGDPIGLRLEDLVNAIRMEFRENEELPNAGNSDDWAKIQGQRGDRITFIRTLIDEGEAGGRSIERAQTGQYL
ncbi:MAG: AAA family ATPase, partial [Acidobacteria bacterium]|nr:AAA family ATPase [Acidobacteriota bacterium]